MPESKLTIKDHGPSKASTRIEARGRFPRFRLRGMRANGPKGGIRLFVLFHPLEVQMALTKFKVFICLLVLSDPTLAQAKCLRTVSELNVIT